MRSWAAEEAWMLVARVYMLTLCAAQGARQLRQAVALWR